jgi:hypothetical protein
MVKTVPLVCSLIVLLVIGSAATVKADGDLDLLKLPISLSNLGLDCITKVACGQINDLLSGKLLPAINGDLNLLLGLLRVKFGLTELKIGVDIKLNATIRLLEVHPGNPKKYTLVLALVDVEIPIKARLGLHLQGLLLLNQDIVVDVDIMLAKAKISATIDLTIDDEGRPTLEVVACVCDFTAVTITINGCPVLLVAPLTAVLKPVLQVNLEVVLCAALRVAVTQDGIKILAQVTVASSLTGLIPGADPLKPLGLVVTDLANKVLDVVENLLNGFLATITKDLLVFGDLLRTTCTDDCIGKRFPLLATNYLNLPVVLNVKVTGTSFKIISLLNVEATINVDVDVCVRQADGTLLTVLSLKLVVKARLNVVCDGKGLRVEVLCVSIDLKVGGSLLGDCTDNQLAWLRDILLKILCQEWNKLALDHIVPLPLPGLFNLVNVVLKVVGGVVVLVADLLCYVVLPLLG